MPGFHGVRHQDFGLRPLPFCRADGKYGHPALSFVLGPLTTVGLCNIERKLHRVGWFPSVLVVAVDAVVVYRQIVGTC